MVCVAVAAFQVFTLIGSHRFMLARLAGLTVRDPRRIGPATLASAIMLAAAYPLARGLAAQGLSSPVTIMIVAIVAAPLYVVALRLLSPAAGTTCCCSRGGSAQADGGAGAVPRRLPGTERLGATAGASAAGGRSRR